MTRKTPIEQAVENAGGPSAMAKALGVYPSNVNYWMRVRLPAERVLRVEELTGVSRHDLRPDIFPREETAA